MSIHQHAAPTGRATRAQRRAERRRLQRCDVLTTRLGELHTMRSLLQRAADVVERGWVQGAWFLVATRSGGTRAVTAQGLGQVRRVPVVGACLVGSIVEAGGGPASIRSQVVARSLDLTWHTLYEDPRRPVQWCPGPDARMWHLQDLTRWNDAAVRTQGEVVGLLVAAQHTVDAQRDLCRDELAAVAASSWASQRNG